MQIEKNNGIKTVCLKDICLLYNVDVNIETVRRLEVKKKKNPVNAIFIGQLLPPSI